MSIYADVRQLLFPKLFRIRSLRAYVVPGFADALAVLLASPESSAKADDSGLTLKQQEKLVVELATELWRLRNKLTKEGTDEPRDEFRRLFRHVASAWDMLADSKVEIHTHTGQLFRSGLAVEVVAFQPTEGISRETIIETVRPSIYFHGRHVQHGQVIVGTPPDTR